MEKVTILRGAQAWDEDGNPIHGQPGEWKTLDALVAPASVPESPTETAGGVTWTHDIYVRGEPTGVLGSDLVRVRGVTVPVDGVVASWTDPQGRHVGDVIHVNLERSSDAQQ